ncbi:MAG TPA: NHL repeat-containing protein [Candidatus Acidoferrales bacterium]|nr:NHL repeat-containing protein [Candidatus Acidoferrales bacterium]
MRRVLSVCAVGVVLCAAVLFAQKEANSIPQASEVQTVVVAQGVAARALAIGQQDSIYATEDSSDRIFSLRASSSTTATAKPFLSLTPIAGTGTVGSLGDGGAAISAQLALSTNSLYERSSVAVAADGTLYLADTDNSTIRSIAGPTSSEPGVIRSIAGRWAPPQNLTLSRPMGVALDRSGDVYISDRQAGALDVLHQDTGLLETIAQISSPGSVAVTPDGAKVFVSSPVTGNVFAVDVRSRSLRAVQGISTQSSADSTAPPCSQGSDRLCPAGLAVDAAGNLFVADSTSGQILRVDARSGAVSVAISNLQQPGALAFDLQRRNLYVVEQGAGRIIEAQSLGSPSTALALSPSSWTFSDEPMGGVSAQQQFTLTNNSQSTVSGIQITSPPMPGANADFSLESTSCLPTLAANATCVISVSFTPKSSTAAQFNPVSSALSVSDSSSDSASSTLTGTANDYQIQLASGQPLEVSVVAGNAATFNLQVVSLGSFGQNGEQVSVTCPSGTPAQSVCTVSPPTVSPKPGSPASVAVKIQTSSTITQASHVLPMTFDFPGAPTGLLIFVSVLALIGFGVLAASRGRLRYIYFPAFVLCAAILLNGCHHASRSATATPAGATQILLQGAALNQSGAPLNATRGITVTLDVLKI